MVCLYCGSETQVKNSRAQKRNNQIWRRRECLSCKATFTTHEAADLSGVLRVETSGAFKPFSADILFTELLLALQDRKDCYSAAREVTATVIQNLLKLPSSPVFSPAQISHAASLVLQRLDRRAFLRFAAEHPSLEI